MDTEELIEKITTRVKENLILFSEDPFQVPVGVSARHVHLAREHVELLFGRGYRLTPLKNLSQKNQFACAEQVSLIGPKGELEKEEFLVRREWIRRWSCQPVTAGVWALCLL